MKKILIFSNSHTGLYYFRKELIIKLLEKNHNIIIVLPYGEKIEELKKMGCRFINVLLKRRAINPVSDLKLLITYISIIKHVKPDIALTYSIKPNIYGGMACSLEHVPYSANITGLGTAFKGSGFLQKFCVLLYRIAFKNINYVFFQNAGNKNIFIKNKIIPPEKSCLLNGSGIDTNEYGYEPYPADGTCRFLFSGRFMAEKGIDELLDAAQRIKKEYDNVFFDFIGLFEEEKYKKIFEEFIDKKVINYYGYQSDVKPYIKKCHCCILPSYHEGMSNTLLEVASMGRPLITSEVHGCMEAVNGKNGYLCKAKNTEDLYLKIKQFIGLPHAEKTQMGIESRKYMIENFERSKIVDKIIATLEL